MPVLAIAQKAKADAQATAPQLSYQSAFADYKPYKDIPLANWPAVNDAVAGGMQGMGQTPMPIASSPAKPTPEKPMHEGHQTHGKKQGGKQ
jgi:hypothetical protein